jgi:hypothetical protein
MTATSTKEAEGFLTYDSKENIFMDSQSSKMVNPTTGDGKSKTRINVVQTRGNRLR